MLCKILEASTKRFATTLKDAKISADREKLEGYVLGDRRKEVDFQALNIVSELILMDEIVSFYHLF